MTESLKSRLATQRQSINFIFRGIGKRRARFVDIVDRLRRTHCLYSRGRVPYNLDEIIEMLRFGAKEEPGWIRIIKYSGKEYVEVNPYFGT